MEEVLLQAGSVLPAGVHRPAGFEAVLPVGVRHPAGFEAVLPRPAVAVVCPAGPVGNLSEVLHVSKTYQ